MTAFRRQFEAVLYPAFDFVLHSYTGYRDVGPVHAAAALYRCGSLKPGQCVCVNNLTYSVAPLNLTFM